MTRAVIEIFQNIASYIHDLRSSLEEKGSVDVAELDDKLKMLTSQINALPLEKRLAYRTQLGELHDALLIFEHELIARKEMLRQQLQSVGTHHQANTAYRTTSHSHTE